MAKANDKSSTIDWIWLRDALALSVKALGSVALAKELLRKWLAAGKLPWSCTSWKGLDAEGIAWLEQESRVGILSGKILFLIPSTAYHQGDPQFWLASLTIDWEDNLAGENAVEGAKASGVKVSRNHLLALLPEEPRERVEELGQIKPAEPALLEPKARPTRSQSKRAARYIKKIFPDGPDGITTAAIRKKLAEDTELQKRA